jgi:hypothetical protein
MTIDEAELDPDEFAQKINAQQVSQDQVKSMHLLLLLFIIESLKQISLTVTHIAAT